jgi:tRNA(fMet)-specific endonuclease VapC
VKYLIDSDCLIDFLKGIEGAVRFFEGPTPSETLVSLISYGEIYEGVIFSTNRERREAEFKKLMGIVEIVGLDTETMDIFAVLRGNLERDGKKLSDFDLLIASTAIRQNLTLVTRNLNHFQRVPGLKLFSLRQQSSR